MVALGQTLGAKAQHGAVGSIRALGDPLEVVLRTEFEEIQVCLTRRGRVAHCA
jgi:hypothetical protein